MKATGQKNEAPFMNMMGGSTRACYWINTWQQAAFEGVGLLPMAVLEISGLSWVLGSMRIGALWEQRWLLLLYCVHSEYHSVLIPSLENIEKR
jgi:hypothetical protein